MLWFAFSYPHEEWCSCQQHGWQVFLCVASCISHQNHPRKEPTVSFVLMALSLSLPPPLSLSFDILTVLSQTWDAPAPDCWAWRPVPHSRLNVLLQYSPLERVQEKQPASCVQPLPVLQALCLLLFSLYPLPLVMIHFRSSHSCSISGKKSAQWQLEWGAHSSEDAAGFAFVLEGVLPCL